MYTTRRDFMAAAAMVPLAAAMPQHTQRLPLVRLPEPSPPSGLGLGAPWQSGDNVPAMLETLRPAWWYDWLYSQCGAPGYVPMIWSDVIWENEADEIISLFERRPDAFWLLWNEPERRDQANFPPYLGARYTAEIAAHGIQYAAPGVALTGDGYRWLEDYLAAGGPTPHMWHVHIYHCTETLDWTVSWALWVDWMHEHNVVRPTIVSETNGWTEDNEGQRDMLDHVAAMLEQEELLQAVAWFATRYEWGAGHPLLLDDAGSMTPVGDTFASIRAMRE